MPVRKNTFSVHQVKVSVFRFVSPPPNWHKALILGLKGKRHHCTRVHATSSEKASIQRQSENEHISNQNFALTELLVGSIMEKTELIPRKEKV